MRAVVCYESVDSTNSAASLLARAGAVEGTVVLAAEQTAGRGRKGREWYSGGDGSLVFSLVLRPSRSGETLTSLLALCALRVLDGIRPGAKMKWPNDIWIDGRKVAGILAESAGEAVVLGMGMNVNDEAGSFPGRLEGTAVSLRMTTGRTFDRGRLLASILGEFSRAYPGWRRKGFAPLREEMQERMLWIGMPVAVETDGDAVSGVMAGVTADGFLRLETEEGEKVFAAGDVSLRKESAE